MNMIPYTPAPPPAKLAENGSVIALTVGGMSLTEHQVANWDDAVSAVMMPPMPGFRMALAMVRPKLAAYEDGGEVFVPDKKRRSHGMAASFWGRLASGHGITFDVLTSEERTVNGKLGWFCDVAAWWARPGRDPMCKRRQVFESYESGKARYQDERALGASVQTKAERNATIAVLGLPARFALTKNDKGQEVSELAGRVFLAPYLLRDTAHPDMLKLQIEDSRGAGKRLYGDATGVDAEFEDVSDQNDPDGDSAEPEDVAPAATAATNPRSTPGKSAEHGTAPDKLPGQPSLPSWWRWEDADKAAQFRGAVDEIQLANVIAELDTPEALGKVARKAFAEYSSLTDFADPANATKPMQSAAYHFALARVELWRRAPK